MPSCCDIRIQNIKLFISMTEELTDVLFLNVGSSFVPDQYKAWLQTVNSMISGVKKSVEEEDLMLIAMLPCREGHLYLEMKNYLKKIAGNPLFPLLEITCQQHKPLDVLFNEAAADPLDLADYSPENEAKVQSNYTTT